jgi:hypothetical protein
MNDINKMVLIPIVQYNMWKEKIENIDSEKKKPEKIESEKILNQML